MSEDLDSFFAKRKTKASKKKAIRLDDVAQTLEYNLKFGQDEAEIPVAGKRDSDFPTNQDEDSEWIQYNSKPAIPLETVGVFNYNEQVEQEHIAEERQQQAERTRTWQKSESESVKEQTPVPTPAPVKETPKPQISSAPAPYRPPNSRSGGHTGSARLPFHKLDIGSEELFPSLEKADQIEKVEKEKEKTRVEEPRQQQPLNPTPKGPQDVRFQNAWASKEKTPEVLPESKPVLERQEQKPVEPRPNVYQPPAGRTGPVVERSHEPDQQSGNKTYIPKFMRGDDPTSDADLQPASQSGGTGMFNARGEEILISEKPAAVVAQTSWRRGNAVQENERPSDQQQNIRAPPTNPEPTNWRSGPTDHNPQRVQQPARNLPSENSSWRNDSNRPPRRDYEERNERPRNEHTESEGNWRQAGPPQRIHQVQEPKIVARIDNEPINETVTEQNWRSKEEEGAPGDDWHVAAGRQRRTAPQSSPRTNPPQGQPKTGAYIPPNRR